MDAMGAKVTRFKDFFGWSGLLQGGEYTLTRFKDFSRWSGLIQGEEYSCHH
jgi:hypothetical protein